MNDNIKSPPTEPKPTLQPPYTAEESTTQLVLQVSKADHGLIKCIRPKQGTLTLTAATLWKKFSDECRKRGIVDMQSEDEFESLLSGLVMVSKEEHETFVADSAKAQIADFRSLTPPLGAVKTKKTKSTSTPIVGGSE